MGSAIADWRFRRSAPSALPPARRCTGLHLAEGDGRHCDLRDCATNETIAAVEAILSPDTVRERSAAIAKAFADPKRLCVLERLSQGEQSVGDLSRDVGCQVPNMSQHLAVLRRAGIVASRRQGSTVFYRLTDKRVLTA